MSRQLNTQKHVPLWIPRLLLPGLVVLVAGLHAQGIKNLSPDLVTYRGEDGKTYVRVSAEASKIWVTESGYDPNLLIPHQDPQTGMWGYIRRHSLELAVPHQYSVAGQFGNGFAIALRQADSAGVYRVDGEGRAVCIHAGRRGLKRYWEPKPLDVQRLFDDHVMVKEKGKWFLYGKGGTLLVKVAIPDKDAAIEYQGKGHWRVQSNSFETFIDSTGRPVATFKRSEYTVANQLVEEFLAWHGERLHPILRIRDGMLGMLNGRGQFAVPFAWEGLASDWTPRVVFSGKGVMPFQTYYRPTQDSVMAVLGTDGIRYLAHFDGTIIHKFQRGERIAENQFWNGVDLWKKIANCGGLYWVYFNPYTRDSFPGAYEFISDEVAVYELWKPGDKEIRKVFKNVVTGKSMEASSELAYKHIFLETHIFKYRQEYYLPIIIPRQDYGVMDGKGRITIPPIYDHIRFELPFPDAYPVITCSGRDDKYHEIWCKYTPDGRELFGMVEGIRPAVESSDWATLPGSLRMIIPTQFLDYRPLEGIPYPNLLEKVQTQDKSNPRVGYRDIYGTFYF